ncbi:MAG: outer membrane protein assembly factor BamB family protein [Candidatus Zipacnadales bacterium]
MYTLRHSIVRFLLVVVPLIANTPLRAQDTGSTPNDPFIFFTPGLAIMDRDTNHDRFFNNIDTTLVVPHSPHTSIVGTFSLQFRDKPRWSAMGNYDWFLNEAATLRVSAGLFDDELGARVTAFQQRRKFGSGLQLGVINGDLEIGGFITTPFAWGFPLRKQSMNERIAGRQKVTDLGASTALSLSLRGGEADLGTTPAYFYPRNAEWRRFGQGPQGQNATAAALPERLFEVWVAQTAGPVRSCPAIAENTVFVGSDDGYLYALDLSTGSLRWRYHLGSPVGGSPTVAGGKVFVGCDDGSIYCFRTEADKQLSADRIGRQVWRFRTKGSVVDSPLVTASGLVVFGSTDGTIYALDAESARPVWSYTTKGPVTASPVKSGGPLLIVEESGGRTVGRDVLFFASEDGHIYAFGERDGHLLWQVNTGAPVRATPMVWGNKVIVLNDEGKVLALDGRNGRQEWAQTVAGVPAGSPALSNSLAIIPLRSGRLVGLDLKKAQVAWETEVPGNIESTPIAPYGSVIYVGTLDGHLYAIDRVKGEVKWDFLTAGPIKASAAAAHGMLVCASTDGAIYSFAGRAPADGVTKHSLAEGQRMVYVKPAGGTLFPSKPSPVPDLAAVKQTSTPPVEIGLKPPSSVPSASHVIDVPAAPMPPTAATTNLRMQLITEPSDAAELPIQLTNQRTALISWGTTAAVAEVDGEVVHNQNGAISVTRTFNDDGLFPVMMITDKGTSQEQIACRLVVVDTSPEPVARRDVAFSPDGDGTGDTIVFRALAEGGDVAVRVLDIRDAQGHAVRTWSAPGPGETAFIWDGTNLMGDPVPAGTYTVHYTVKEPSGNLRKMTQRVLVQRVGERLAAH